MNVTRDGGSTPTSSSTRTVSSLLVGSTIRPSTSARNASSRTTPNPSASIDPVQGLPQQPCAGRLDHRRPGIRSTGGGRVELQHLLASVQAFPRELLQQRELIVVVRGTDVIDPLHDPAALVHDLHRRRARGGLHPAHERAHGREATHRSRPRLVTTSRGESAAQRPARAVITP